MAVYQIKLLARHKIAVDTYELQFSRPAAFDFIPGQYAAFRINHPQLPNHQVGTRKFSLLSAPHDDVIKIALRLTDSLYKRILHELTVGSELTMIGPAGKFILPSDPQIPVVLLAGGIGITPFYSMLCHQSFVMGTLSAQDRQNPFAMSWTSSTQHADKNNNQDERQITLFYVNQTTATAPYLAELSQLSLNNFKFIPTLTRSNSLSWGGECGGFTRDLLFKYLSKLTSAIYYVCGHQTMVHQTTELLLGLEIPSTQIKCEDFPGYNF